MRRLAPLAALTVLAAAASGCGGPGRDLFNGGALPATDGVQNPVYTIAPSFSPTLFTANGYLISASAAPNLTTYRVVWVNTDRASRHFTGSAWTPGNFVSRDPGCTSDGQCPLESGDFVSTIHAVTGGNRIDWDTFSGSSDLDGVDFTVDVEPVMFDFFVDGARIPTNVVFPDGTNGGRDASVAQIPFGLQR